ncbi:MAG: MBL fold metallo-hydrolase [Candidatus Nezhaarchaeales archaeon]
MRLIVKTLIDNKPNPENPKLKGAHGLSLLLDLTYDKENVKILFDTGPSPDVLKANSEKLNVNLRDVKIIVISHGHYDHADGIPAALGSTKPIIIHPNAFTLKVRSKPYIRFIGMRYNKRQLRDMGGMVLPLREKMEISRGIYISGEVKGDRRVDPDLCIVDDSGSLSIDPMIDEQYLLARINNKNIMIVGCSHPGIDVMAMHCLRLFSIKRIDAIIGGFHTAWSNPDYIEKIALKLKELGVEQLYPGHCTGDRGIKILKNVYGGKCEELHVGFELSF